jgi:excisionase family DNA binding protein
MSAKALDPVRPAEGDVTAAVEALPHVQGYLAAHPDVPFVTLRVTDGAENEVLTVPRGAVELLARVLAHMANGQGVSVVPANAELTTQQAADLLNVSRPFLIGLLNAGEIRYRLVGKHRRILAEDLLNYLRNDDHRRRDAADELTALGQDIGLI